MTELTRFNLTLGSKYGAKGKPVIITALHLSSAKSIPSDIFPVDIKFENVN
jgi:hypothetical protein